ncbi:unnamed protein product, partial [Porites lobata]
TLEWTLPLYEVYNTEINWPRVENEALRFHYQQLNVQVHAVQQENEQKIEKIQNGNSARNEKRQKIKKLVIQSLPALDEFKPVEIKFDVQGQEVIIPLSEEDSSEELEPTSCETTKRVLVAKDSGLISDEAYHELRMSLPEDQRFALPPFSAVKQERNKQNEIVNIKSIPEAKNGDGARRSIKEVLEQLLTILRVKKAVQSNGNMISLRFAADGRRTSNKIGTVKAEFSLIEEKENDCDHQYCVALCNRNKDYKEAKACLGPILDQIDNLHVNGAEVDGVHYSKLIYVSFFVLSGRYCCSDWKFLAMVVELVINKKGKEVLEKQLEDIGVPFKFFEGFDELVTALEAEPGQECYKPPDLFREQARKWAMFFRVVHFDEDIPPYIHATKEALELYLRKFVKRRCVYHLIKEDLSPLSGQTAGRRAKLTKTAMKNESPKEAAPTYLCKRCSMLGQWAKNYTNSSFTTGIACKAGMLQMWNKGPFICRMF